MLQEEPVSINIQVADVLEQIDKLDKMIDFHKKNSPDDAMLKQYQYLRRRYARELNKLMAHYRFQLSPMKPSKKKPLSTGTSGVKVFRPLN